MAEKLESDDEFDELGIEELEVDPDEQARYEAAMRAHRSGLSNIASIVGSMASAHAQPTNPPTPPARRRKVGSRVNSYDELLEELSAVSGGPAVIRKLNSVVALSNEPAD